MKHPDYISIYERACERKGGEALLEALLPESPGNAQLAALSSDRYLAEFTRKIFQSGFVWRVVDNKWANFEEIFWNFDIERLLMMPEEMLERKAKDPAIIRNFNKVKTIPQNALMIDDVERREGRAFGEFIADWPEEDAPVPPMTPAKSAPSPLLVPRVKVCAPKTTLLVVSPASDLTEASAAVIANAPSISRIAPLSVRSVLSRVRLVPLPTFNTPPLTIMSPSKRVALPLFRKVSPVVVVPVLLTVSVPLPVRPVPPLPPMNNWLLLPLLVMLIVDAPLTVTFELLNVL